MIYELVIPQLTKMLRNYIAILEKGASLVEAKKIDMEVLLKSRLAPDQFSLLKQVQITCDTAKLGASRLSGKEAPSHPDTEKTLPELISRINSVITYLQSFTAKDFEAYQSRKVSQPRWEGKYLNGEEYLWQHLLPNFYFHLTTGYSILRHNGVDIGKKDYLGELPFRK